MSNYLPTRHVFAMLNEPTVDARVLDRLDVPPTVSVMHAGQHVGNASGFTSERHRVFTWTALACVLDVELPADAALAPDVGLTSAPTTDADGRRHMSGELLALTICHATEWPWQ